MKHKWSLALAFLTWLAPLAALANLTSYTLTLPGGWSAIANQFVQPSPTLSSLLPSVPDGTQVAFPTYSPSGFQGFNLYYFDGFSHAWLPNGNAQLVPGNGALLLNPTAGNMMVTFFGQQHVPVLPAAIPVGQLTLVSRQTNDVGTYENIVGRPPGDGAMVYRLIPGCAGITNIPSPTSTNCYLTYVFTNFTWQPEDPEAQVGESVWIRRVDGTTTTGLRGVVFEVDAFGRQVGPLAGATVTVSNASPQSTDTNGGFLFTNLDAGTYTVTITNTGFYSASRIVTLATGQMLALKFQLLRQTGPGAPSEFGFVSTNGNYFIPAMPGNLTFSVTVAWNGTPGSVFFNMAGTPVAPTTLADQGNGTALATLTVPAPAAIAVASELTLVVTNGQGLGRAFNLGAYFEPLPGAVPTWFTWLGNSLTWSPSIPSGFKLPKLNYSYKNSYPLFSLSLPGDSLEFKSSLDTSLKVSFDLFGGAFNGSAGATGNANLKLNLPDLAGVELFASGSIGLNGTLQIALAGLAPPKITPAWSASIGTKAGLRAPAVTLVPAVFPPAAPAIATLQKVPVVQSIINSIKLGATVTQGGNLKGVYKNAQLGNCFLGTTGLSGSVTAGLEVEATAKLDGAKARIYGGGNGTLTFNLCPLFSLTSLTLQAYVGFSAETLIYDYNKQYTATLQFGGNGQSMSVLNVSGYERQPAADWQPLGSNLKRWGLPDQLAGGLTQFAGWPQGSPGPQPRDGTPGGSAGSLLVSNVVDLASPSVFADPAETLVLFTLYDSQKPWYAATDIGALRQINGGAWSLTHVTDDAMADFSPKVIGLNSNLLLAAWERVVGDVSGTTNPVQVSPHLEIAAAWFDRQAGVWSAPNQLTTNSVVDRDPLPVALGTGPGILWIQNQADAGIGDATNGDSLVFSPWTGTSWGPMQTLWAGPNGILTFSFVADAAGEGHVVFAVDQDGTLDTATDRELYGAATVGGVWQPATRLTSDSLEDSLPTLLAPNGVPLCVWSHDDGLVYSRLSPWNPKPVFFQSTDANHTPTLDGVTLPGGGAVAYAVATLDGVDLFSSFYDATRDAWSLPRQLTQDEDVESSVAVAFNGTNLVAAYEKTQTLFADLDIDVDGQTQTLTNVPQPGRTDLYLLTHLPGADPGLVASSLTINPPNPAPGSNATLSAVIENFGDVPVQNVPVAFYDGDPHQGGTQIGSVQTISSSLVGGATQAVAVAWTVPAAAHAHDIYVVVDPALSLNDRDRSNNSADQLTVLPDLTIDSSSYSEAGATRMTLLAQVVNQGVISSGPCTVSWRLDSADGEEIGHSALGSLAAGQGYSLTYQWDTSGRGFADAYVPVYVVADSSNVVQEIDKSNNDALQMVPAAASWVPRLAGIQTLADEVQLAFTAANSAPTDFLIESAGSLQAPISWEAEPGAAVSMTVPGVFQAQVAPRGAVRFYRVRRPL